jgi:hypothetical protein
LLPMLDPFGEILFAIFAARFIAVWHEQERRMIAVRAQDLASLFIKPGVNRFAVAQGSRLVRP